MTQHTPGPWKDRITTGDTAHAISGGYDPTTNRNGEGVCLIPFKYCGGGEGSARRAANARLIAKAPEMYDLIKRLYEIIDKFGVYPWPAVLDELENARILLNTIERARP